LTRGSRGQRHRKRGRTPHDAFVVGHRRIARERADAQGAVAFLDAVERQVRDVHERARCHHARFHQIDERRAARKESRVFTRGDALARRHGRFGNDVRKRLHARAAISFAASRTASTMFGYAPHRQRLPLIASRIAASSLARPSAIAPTAESTCPAVQNPH
jgi:hypothetical protein